MIQVADRHDALVKLKSELRDLNEKHQEALATIKHRGDVIHQLREEVKSGSNIVSRESC